MATLKITRCSEYVNRLGNIKIFLNNRELGTIFNGETKYFEIKEGIHTLEAKIDWCSSNKITFVITNQQSKAFELNSFSKDHSLGAFAAIYYITFGANKYLNFKEETI